MGFEVLAESELFGKAKLGGDVLDLHVGLTKQVLGLVDGDHVDPLHWRGGQSEVSARERQA